nr:50S ribosomal protein L17 [Pseudomonadota bacterium]NIS71437.1 50S ribosomal protein L17 [Pseudomonadota bacterium]
RQGGFTRVVKLGHRLGDAAPLSVVMLAEATLPKRTQGKAEKKKTTGKASKMGKTSETKAKAEKKKAQVKRAKKVKETPDQGES